MIRQIKSGVCGTEADVVFLVGMVVVADVVFLVVAAVGGGG